MIQAEDFILAAKVRNFGLYTGVPCSYLKPFINYTINSPDLRYVGAANEGDAVAIAAGSELAGVRSVVMFQNSGLGNATNPLTSLTYTFKIPILLIVTLRGEPNGAPDEPQHELMGAITQSLLELMQIPWEYFPQKTENIATVLDKAVEYMQEYQRPYALVMQKGTVANCDLYSEAINKFQSALVEKPVGDTRAHFSRNEILQAIQAAVKPDAILLATTGYTGRELYAIADSDNQFYMVGSMGCVSSFGLGIALAQPDQQIVVLDGDGAALMRLGAMTTIGYERPANLCHILLDNQQHESTGGQSTVSHSVNFSAIAVACGYEKVGIATTLQQVTEWITTKPNLLSFLHVKIKGGTPDKLPRPKITPVELAYRLRQFIGQ
ncbi:MAG: phosphonopyruvate decarboxylase [Halothece sp. Uz-M2-17]|nr:phosphonopyruvate decarboxylase [Halothece sp. Uz-M2-17]